MLKASGVMSRLLAVLLVFAPLFGLSVIAAVAASNPDVAIVAGVWLLLYALVAVLALVEALAMFRRGDAEALGSSARLVKYCGIPFFTANFALLASATGIVLLISSMFAAGVIAAATAAVAVPVLVVGTYLIMLPTSIYGITGAILLRCQGRASTRFAVLTVVLHLVFVADVFATLAVAHRARPERATSARMVRWVAVVVALALLVPTVSFVATLPASVATEQGADELAALPGVARVKGRTVELAPGVTVAQAQAIAARGYTLQDNTSPSDRDRWTLTYGSARLTLKGIEPTGSATQALVVLGPVDLDDSLYLTITAGRTVDSSTVRAFITIAGLNPTTSGGAFTAAAASVSRVLAAAHPKPAGVVNSLGAHRWGVDGERLRSPDTATQLEALSAFLSDDVRLEDLSLDATTSEVNLTVKNESQIAATCQRGLAALADLPGLKLTADRSGTAARDARPC